MKTPANTKTTAEIPSKKVQLVLVLGRSSVGGGAAGLARRAGTAGAGRTVAPGALRVVGTFGAAGIAVSTVVAPKLAQDEGSSGSIDSGLPNTGGGFSPKFNVAGGAGTGEEVKVGRAVVGAGCGSGTGATDAAGASNRPGMMRPGGVTSANGGATIGSTAGGGDITGAIALSFSSFRFVCCSASRNPWTGTTTFKYPFTKADFHERCGAGGADSRGSVVANGAAFPIAGNGSWTHSNGGGVVPPAGGTGGIGT